MMFIVMMIMIGDGDDSDITHNNIYLQSITSYQQQLPVPVVDRAVAAQQWSCTHNPSIQHRCNCRRITTSIS
jgi:hypothetical protein